MDNSGIDHQLTQRGGRQGNEQWQQEMENLVKGKTKALENKPYDPRDILATAKNVKGIMKFVTKIVPALETAAIPFVAAGSFLVEAAKGLDRAHKDGDRSSQLNSYRDGAASELEHLANDHSGKSLEDLIKHDAREAYEALRKPGYSWERQQNKGKLELCKFLHDKLVAEGRASVESLVQHYKGPEGFPHALRDLGDNVRGYPPKEVHPGPGGSVKDSVGGRAENSGPSTRTENPGMVDKTTTAKPDPASKDSAKVGHPSQDKVPDPTHHNKPVGGSPDCQHDQTEAGHLGPGHSIEAPHTALDPSGGPVHRGHHQTDHRGQYQQTHHGGPHHGGLHHTHHGPSGHSAPGPSAAGPHTALDPSQDPGHTPAHSNAPHPGGDHTHHQADQIGTDGAATHPETHHMTGHLHTHHKTGQPGPHGTGDHLGPAHSIHAPHTALDPSGGSVHRGQHQQPHHGGPLHHTHHGPSGHSAPGPSAAGPHTPLDPSQDPGHKPSSFSTNASTHHTGLGEHASFGHAASMDPNQAQSGHLQQAHDHHQAHNVHAHPGHP